MLLVSLKIKHADGAEEHFIHDAEGRLLVHIDPKVSRHVMNTTQLV